MNIDELRNNGTGNQYNVQLVKISVFTVVVTRQWHLKFTADASGYNGVHRRSDNATWYYVTVD